MAVSLRAIRHSPPNPHFKMIELAVLDEPILLQPPHNDSGGDANPPGELTHCRIREQPLRGEPPVLGRRNKPESPSRSPRWSPCPFSVAAHCGRALTSTTRQRLRTSWTPMRPEWRNPLKG